MVVHTIARDGIAIVAHPACPVAGLSMEQVRGIFDGSIDNCSQVGGSTPTTAHVNDGSYPVVRPLNLVTMGQPTGAVAQFINFVFSAEGQAIVAEDYIPVR